MDATDITGVDHPVMDQRTEVIFGAPVHAWSRPHPRAETSPEGFRRNHYQVVWRDGATIYQSHAEYPITEMERDMFVSVIAVIRATRRGTPWPFAGIGITDAGPSPYGWLWDDTAELAEAD